MPAQKTRIISPGDGYNRVHTYFLTSPYHPSGKKVLCTKFKNLRSEGHVSLINTEDGTEEELGSTGFFNYNHGSGAFLCDGGSKVIYQEKERTVVCAPLSGSDKKKFKGKIGGYSGNVNKKFIEGDYGYSLSNQGNMGIYLRNIDGTEKKCLATVDKMLAAHPHGSSIKGSGVLLRVGGQISPDQKKVLLYLVTRTGLLVRDYFICGADGSGLEFHGRAGGHVSWHPDSTDIFAFVKPHTSLLDDFRSPAQRRRGVRHGLLARYNIKSFKMEVVSPFKIRGRCHVSPSPDGKLVVMDGIRDYEGKVSIMLCDTESGKTRTLRTEKNTRNLKNRRNKSYVVDAHPAFSPDGGKIIFNSCESDIVRLREIAL